MACRSYHYIFISWCSVFVKVFSSSYFSTNKMATSIGCAPNKESLRAMVDVNILLTGKTGNGKSSTGNSILGSKQFVSKASTTSVTNCVQVGLGDFQDNKLKVVDCPGVGDTRMGAEEALDLMMTSVQLAVEENPQGYDAILLAVRFGERFTKEDLDTVGILKNVLGEDFIRKYGILMLTCGDFFEREKEETGKSFTDWCAEQEGEFQKLLGECQNRVVLFDNVTKDKQKQNDQVESLINVIECCKDHDRRYTSVEFDCAKPTREKLYVEMRKESTVQEINTQINVFLQKKQLIAIEEDLEKKELLLGDLKIEAANLCGSIEERDRNTGVLSQILESGRTLLTFIQEDINIVSRMKEEQARMAAEQAENQRRMEEKHRLELEEQARVQAQQQAALQAQVQAAQVAGRRRRRKNDCILQ